MTRKEWLDIGYEKNIIDTEDYEEITFRNAYAEWFKMKIRTVKQPTVDRIEVTYNRHFQNNELIEKCISKITDSDIIVYFTAKCRNEKLCKRELDRIMGIFRGVCTYMRDLNKGNCPLHDWEKIKRNIPKESLSEESKEEYAINPDDIEYIMRQVIDGKIYYQKQSACLCICMNFFLGLRIGELSALKFSDFDFEKNLLYVNKIESKFYSRDENGEKIGSMTYCVVDHTKTECSTREVPLIPEVVHLYNLIKKHHEEQHYDSEYLAYDGGQTILSRSLSRTISKLIKLCDTMYFSSHGIRKTFATTLHHNNVPTRVISDLLGHSEMSTTEKCYILSYEDKSDTYRQYVQNAIRYCI